MPKSHSLVPSHLSLFVNEARGNATFGSLLRSVLLCAAGAAAQAQPHLPVFTSPIDVTGGRITITAFAPDRDTGAMEQQPVPPAAVGPMMTALTEVPINVAMDTRWNGTPAEAAAGTSARQLACDGPTGVRARLAQQSTDTGVRPYGISCNFGTTGEVFVKQVGHALYLSYQILNNTVNFRTTSPLTCSPSNNNPFCPNDPRFEARFAIEVLTLMWTPSICGLRAEQPTVYLHGVQIESHNAAADVAMFVEAAFLNGRFLAAELAMQSTEVRAPISMDAALAELRSSPACTSGTPASRVFSAFSQLETNVKMPAGIELRAVHPPIPAPRIMNVSLPYGEDTCKTSFVWRDAFAGDHVCVPTSARTQAQQDNAQAASRRFPAGGAFGPATCLQGYVWREARVGDVVCVQPPIRAQTVADNAAAASRRVLAPSTTPSFSRPSVNAQPVVAAGASFVVSGKFYPAKLDPTTVAITIERDSNTACFGGATEMESVHGGGSPQFKPLPPNAGALSFCAYRHEARPLQTSTAYRFRVRDCDSVTCSLWSSPFETLTGSLSAGPGPVAISLDTGAILGSATTDSVGAFQVTVTMPANTPAGTHKLSGSSGTASDTTNVQVTGGAQRANLIVTGKFFGDTGCPMRTAPNSIAAGDSFSLFGSGFQPGLVQVSLDATSGLSLGSAQAQADGTFCAYFSGPPTSAAGQHNLVASQVGSQPVTLPVRVVIASPIH